MKNYTQMYNHEPSSLIQLHDGMVLSFIDYKIIVSIGEQESQANLSSILSFNPLQSLQLRDHRHKISEQISHN